MEYKENVYSPCWFLAIKVCTELKNIVRLNCWLEYGDSVVRDLRRLESAIKPHHILTQAL